MNYNNFTKETIRELYIALEKEGIWYMQSLIDNTINHRLPNKGLYLHVKPSWIKCKQFFKDLEDNHIDLFKEVLVGSGTVDNGESWGDFYDLKIENKKAVKNLFNEFQKEFSFGYYKEL